MWPDNERQGQFCLLNRIIQGQQQDNSSPKNENYAIYSHLCCSKHVWVYFLLNTKEDILKKVGNQTVDSNNNYLSIFITQHLQ